MRLFDIKLERLPMVWLLAGLLFVSAGLFLGFDFRVTFGYFFVGLLCCGAGAVLFVLHLMEPPGKPEGTRLSANFISAGSTVAMPAMPKGENEPEAGQEVAANG